MNPTAQNKIKISNIIEYFYGFQNLQRPHFASFEIVAGMEIIYIYIIFI